MEPSFGAAFLMGEAKGGEGMGAIPAILVVAIGVAIGYATAYRKYKK